MNKDYNKPENMCIKCIHYTAGYCPVIKMDVCSLYVCPAYEGKGSKK